MGRLPHSLPTPQFLPQNTPFISFIALMPSSGSEKATNPYPLEPFPSLFSTTRHIVNEG